MGGDAEKTASSISGAVEEDSSASTSHKKKDKAGRTGTGKQTSVSSLSAGDVIVGSDGSGSAGGEATTPSVKLPAHLMVSLSLFTDVTPRDSETGVFVCV